MLSGLKQEIYICKKYVHIKEKQKCHVMVMAEANHK